MSRRRILQLTGAGVITGAAATSGVVSGETDYPNSIIFDGTVSKGKSKYEFEVSGSIDPDNGAATREGNDVIDGNRAKGAVHRDTDVYHFSGTLSYLDVKGDAEVSIEYGDEDDVAADRLEIISQSSVDYSFTTTDRIEMVTDNGDRSAESSNDSVTENDDGTWTATGYVGNGYGDTYDFWGEMTHFEPVDGDYTLFLNGEETTVTELTGQEPEQSGYPLTIDDFDGGTIRNEWGNAANHATTDALAHTGSHAVYRVDGSSLYDDGTGFEDAFKNGGRFLSWTFYIADLQPYTSFRLGFNGDGPPAPNNFSELFIDANNEAILLREGVNGDIDVTGSATFEISTDQWYEVVAWWGHDTVECGIYDATGARVGYLEVEDHANHGEYWWLFDEQAGNGAVFDSIRFHEEHPYNGRYYTDPPESSTEFEEREDDIVISPDGSDADGDGSYGTPYHTLQAAFDEAIGGERIVCRGGTYQYRSTQDSHGADGSSSNPTLVRPYGDESPVFDFANHDTSGGEGIFIRGTSWWEIRDIEIRNAPAGGARIDGIRFHNVDDSVLDGVESHGHGGDGLRMSNVTNVVIRNCESHDNVDESESNADGLNFTGDVNNCVVEHCKFYANADDGIDFFNVTSSVRRSCTVRYCAIYDNDSPSGGFNAGIKLGGDDGVVNGNHLVHHCALWGNQRGIHDNRTDAAHTVHNCVGYNNENGDFGFPNTPDSGSHELRNCQSVTNNVGIDDGNDDDFCTWTENIDQSDQDVRSLDPNDFAMWGEEGDYLRLGTNCQGIDAGVELDYNYEGDAPDVAGFERSHDAQDPL